MQVRRGTRKTWKVSELPLFLLLLMATSSWRTFPRQSDPGAASVAAPASSYCTSCRTQRELHLTDWLTGTGGTGRLEIPCETHHHGNNDGYLHGSDDGSYEDIMELLATRNHVENIKVQQLITLRTPVGGLTPGTQGHRFRFMSHEQDTPQGGGGQPVGVVI